MSCYTGFFNVRRGWQSLNTGPRFYLRLIRRTGWLWIYTSRTTDGRPFKRKKLSVPFLYPGVPAGLTPFRGLLPLGRRNLVPILPRHTLWWAHPLVELEQTYHGGLLIPVSEWLLFNVNSAIFQLDHCENKLIFNEMMMNTACLAEKQQIPIVSSLVWAYRGSNSLFTVLEVSKLTTTSPTLVLLKRV